MALRRGGEGVRRIGIRTIGEGRTRLGRTQETRPTVCPTSAARCWPPSSRPGFRFPKAQPPARPSPPPLPPLPHTRTCCPSPGTATCQATTRSTGGSAGANGPAAPPLLLLLPPPATEASWPLPLCCCFAAALPLAPSPAAGRGAESRCSSRPPGEVRSSRPAIAGGKPPPGRGGSTKLVGKAVEPRSPPPPPPAAARRPITISAGGIRCRNSGAVSPGLRGRPPPSTPPPLPPPPLAAPPPGRMPGRAAAATISGPASRPPLPSSPLPPLPPAPWPPRSAPIGARPHMRSGFFRGAHTTCVTRRGSASCTQNMT